jgi:hypothetical protein
LGVPAALIVIVVGNLAEWGWHEYPWYIQRLNIGANPPPAFQAGEIFETVHQGAVSPDLNGALVMDAALLIFVLGDHLMISQVVKLARGQSFAAIPGGR